MTEWIPVNKQKPSDYKLVNVRDKDGRAQVGWWTGGAWDFGKEILRGPVTHWCEITAGERIKKCRVSDDKSSVFTK